MSNKFKSLFKQINEIPIVNETVTSETDFNKFLNKTK